MSKMKSDLTYEEVAEWLTYDPDTGSLKWIAGRRVGHEAGTLNRGYLQVNIRGSIYRAHRLAWLLHTGSWPTNVIDHIDRNPSNNRISNLRDVPQAINNQNVRALGATYHRQRKKWCAQIKIGGGRKKHLGLFETQEEASAAYFAAKAKYHVAIRVVEAGA